MRLLRLSAFFVGLLLVLGASCGKGTPGSTGQTVSPSASPTAFPKGTVSPSPLSNLPRCQKRKKLAMPAWVPKDLPLPDGTFFTSRITGQGGYHEGLFVFPLSTADIAKFVLTKW